MTRQGFNILFHKHDNEVKKWEKGEYNIWYFYEVVLKKHYDFGSAEETVISLMLLELHLFDNAEHDPLYYNLLWDYSLHRTILA